MLAVFFQVETEDTEVFAMSRNVIIEMILNITVS